jgi:hypothetical protein
MTAAGLMGSLTGFDRAIASANFFGLSFLTPFLAFLLLTDATRIKTSPLNFCMVGLNPFFMVSGPIPKTGRLRLRLRWRVLWRRLRVVQGDMIVGLFFISMAKSFSPLLPMKDSLQPLDVLLFGAVFEGYVYFNFAGYSMLAWGVLRLMGVDAPRNFTMPFCSTSVVEYWKRWHISLSNVLRELFFKPNRAWLGVHVAAVATFVASAMWHGVTLNFALWGLFHATCWGLSRWLYIRYVAQCFQISLLIFAIIIGRILFAESDTELLSLKFAGLLDIAAWRETGYTVWILSALSIKQITLLFLATGLLLSEYKFAKGTRWQHYQHLKTPWMSSLLLALVVFFGNFGDEGAVYGQR